MRDRCQAGILGIRDNLDLWLRLNAFTAFESVRARDLVARSRRRRVAGPLWPCVYRHVGRCRSCRLDYWCGSGSLDAARRWRPCQVGCYRSLRADRHEAVARIASGGGDPSTNHRNSTRQRRSVPNAPRWRCAVIAHRLCAVDYPIGKPPSVAWVAWKLGVFAVHR
jgi:hypothetical protein